MIRGQESRMAQSRMTQSRMTMTQSKSLRAWIANFQRKPGGSEVVRLLRWALVSDEWQCLQGRPIEESVRGGVCGQCRDFGRGLVTYCVHGDGQGRTGKPLFSYSFFSFLFHVTLLV